MERFIAQLVKRFESGAIDRREFCQTVALAATVYAAGDAAQAQTRSGFKVLAVNHFGYTCPDYTKSRDFYTSVFGLENLKETSGRANLGFGPAPGKGGSFMIVRNPVAANANRPQPKALVDHICFTMSNWDEAKVKAALDAKGQKITGGRPGSLHVRDPFNYDVQFANIKEENAFRRGTN
jgi:catechol 2,3-dioxygenase-like lactoylglutathione lyase family enzyme